MTREYENEDPVNVFDGEGVEGEEEYDPVQRLLGLIRQAIETVTSECDLAAGEVMVALGLAQGQVAEAWLETEGGYDPDDEETFSVN